MAFDLEQMDFGRRMPSLDRLCFRCEPARWNLFTPNQSSPASLIMDIPTGTVDFDRWMV
jgi:hypothetical protein